MGRENTYSISFDAETIQKVKSIMRDLGMSRSQAVRFLIRQAANEQSSDFSVAQKSKNEQ